ncbi:MAG TPA: restriction endonuclease subunit S [Candidatus Woesebacteria bacterium]|nr:restriction endonuclease subunit S [Candidatus Woesebacteria bacterium]
MKTTAQKYRDIESSFEINIIKYILTNHSIGEYVELDLLIDEIKTGKTPSKADNKNYEDRYLKWYKPSDIGNSMYLSETESFVSKYAYNNRSITIFEKDTLLITCIGDIGRMGIVQEQCTSNQQITGITFNNKISVEYIYLYLLVNRRLFYNDVSQTTLPIINQQKLKKIQIKLVDYEEQLRLVKLYKTLQRDGNLEILKTLGYNSDIQLKSKILATLHNNHNKVKSSIGSNLQTLTSLRQQILQDAITGNLSEKWRRDNPNIESAEVLLEKIKAEKEKLVKEGKIRKQKPLPSITENEIPFAIPEGWVWCRLGDIFNFIDYRGKTPRKVNLGIRLITAKNVKQGFLSLSPEEFVASDIYDSWMIRGIPKLNDVLITTEAPLGNVALLSIEEKVVFAQRIIILSQFVELVTHCFMNFMLSPYFQSALSIKQSGMTAKGIKASRLKEVLVPVPPLLEQKYLSNKLSNLLTGLDQIKVSSSRNQEVVGLLNKVLIKEMFSK